jgi:hypothetical protein
LRVLAGVRELEKFQQLKHKQQSPEYGDFLPVVDLIGMRRKFHMGLDQQFPEAQLYQLELQGDAQLQQHLA